MLTGALTRRLLRFVCLLLAFRVLEAAAALVVLVVTSAVHPQLTETAVADWSLQRELSGAWLILRVYYLGFYYLLVSTIVLATAEVVWGLNRTRIATLANMGGFVLHSLAFVLLVFDGDFGVFWATWTAVAIVNTLSPIILGPRLQVWVETVKG